MFSLSRPATREREGGFTLPELLITIAIMGLLLALALPVLTNVLQAGRVTRLKQDVQTSAVALGNYYDRYGKYPDATTFSSSVASVSKGSADVISFLNPNNQPQGNGYDQDVCVLGTMVDKGKNYQFSYNLAKRTLVNGPCQYSSGSLPVEQVQ